MDTTMMSEIEYINIFPPEMERLDQALDDSSFLKGSFVDKSGPQAKLQQKIESVNVSKIEESKAFMQAQINEREEEATKKIAELEAQVEQQKKDMQKLNEENEEMKEKQAIQRKGEKLEDDEKE